MGKTWHFILCYSRHNKTNSLSTARTQKGNNLFQEQRKQIEIAKSTGLPPIKRFLYSHRATLHTLFLQDGQVS
jgi:hypothetical protein